MKWAKCLPLLFAAGLGAAGVLAVQHFMAGEESPPPDPQAIAEDTRAARAPGDGLPDAEAERERLRDQARVWSDDILVKRAADRAETKRLRWKLLEDELDEDELDVLREADETRRKLEESKRKEAERPEELRREYKRSCVETLKKILRLAEHGELAYVTEPVRAAIREAIDCDDYHDLCRALNAMIAIGVVAPAYELEREFWRGNLAEPWSLLVDRAEEAIERHKQAGGTVRVLDRPPSFPHPSPALW